MDIVMPNSLCQGHICQSFFNYLVTVRKHSRCVPINTHLVLNSHQITCFCLQDLFAWLWFVSKMSSFLPLIKNKITMFKKFVFNYKFQRKVLKCLRSCVVSRLGPTGFAPFRGTVLLFLPGTFHLFKF